jgi:hypothetical protein
VESWRAGLGWVHVTSDLEQRMFLCHLRFLPRFLKPLLMTCSIDIVTGSRYADWQCVCS